MRPGTNSRRTTSFDSVLNSARRLGISRSIGRDRACYAHAPGDHLTRSRIYRKIDTLARYSYIEDAIYVYTRYTQPVPAPSPRRNKTHAQPPQASKQKTPPRKPALLLGPDARKIYTLNGKSPKPCALSILKATMHRSTHAPNHANRFFLTPNFTQPATSFLTPPPNARTIRLPVDPRAPNQAQSCRASSHLAAMP